MSYDDEDYGLNFDDLSQAEKRRVMADISENMARTRHEDYDQRVANMYPKLNNDDDFRQRIFSAADPGEALYKASLKDEADKLRDEPLEKILDR